MIDIAPAPGEATRAITQRTFLGEKTDYLVALGGAALQVAASDQYRRPLIEAASRSPCTSTPKASTCCAERSDHGAIALDAGREHLVDRPASTSLAEKISTSCIPR